MRSLALRRLKRTAMIGRLSADTLLRFAGLIGVDPTMVDIARLARKRAQKPQSARGEADGQDLATAEGERS